MLLVDYAPILVMMALAGVLLAVFWLGSVLLGPKQEGRSKQDPFECGHPSQRAPKRRFAIKFYGIAVLFILFDIEAVFLYPWAVVFGELKLFALVEMFIFLGLLFLALVWVWSKGGLEWD
jgi:NADH-quinone oxidoreductase subunit A